MNQDAILSFSTPLGDTRQLVVTPAPVLELTYAYYFMLKRLDRDRDSNLAWVKRLREDQEALEGLRTVWRKREMENLGYELFVLACGLGYATDASPDRFLSDFPTLPGRILDGLEELTDPGGVAKKQDTKSEAERDETNRRLRRHFEVLAEPLAASEMQSALSALWAHLEPAWEREGRAVSETAGEMLEREITLKGDLLAALPPHHFVQFEESAAALRERHHGGKMIVVPLFFASHGGFSMDIGGVDYLGYGVHAESLFREQQDELAELAGRLKAFSDPTRLLLLVLIGRLTQFPLTVGDLAKQAGVSQPTASGHLKILRDMGLVNVVKKGNRSFYRLVEEHARDTVEQLQRVLLS